MTDKTRLDLCLTHKQEWKQSHFDKQNCDYCMLKAENDELKEEIISLNPGITIMDKLSIELVDLRNTYIEIYGDKGHKLDRLRVSILIRLIDEVEKTTKEYKKDYPSHVDD